MREDRKDGFVPERDLRSEQDIVDFLTAAFRTRNSGIIAYAAGVVMRVHGASRVAREAGLSREQLYRSLSEFGNPTLKTMLAVLKALGVDLVALQAGQRARLPQPVTTPQTEKCDTLPTE